MGNHKKGIQSQICYDYFLNMGRFAYKLCLWVLMIFLLLDYTNSYAQGVSVEGKRCPNIP